jgi:hypothetical protein
MPNLEFIRKQAKALARNYRAGEPGAVERVERVLGGRARTRFGLSDAQHVVAREHGHRTWPELKRSFDAPRSRLDAVQAQLDAARASWSDGEDLVLDAGIAYREGEPVEIVVRKRGWRHDVSDGGAAVAKAGRPRGWLAVSERVVEQYWLNVNRRGAVFVQANETRLAPFVLRVADCSVGVYQELLESK